jgi:tetratricopeptide (TPR) repeat protein
MIRLLTVLSLMLATWVLVPVDAVLSQDIATQDRAERLVDDGRYQEAIALLNTIITPASKDARPLLIRAVAHEGRRDFSAAARDYQRVLELNPAHVEARNGLRRTQQQTAARNRGNLESMRRLVAANPTNVSYRIRYADALFSARLFRQAAEQYGEYLRRTQGTPDVVQSFLISIANYEGDNALGERTASKYVKIYTNNDDLYMRLGYFRLWQGKYKPAKEACEQALLLNPNNKEAEKCSDYSDQPGLAGTQSQYPIDVLTRELRAKPRQDGKRFELIDLLIDDGRYFEARQNLDYLRPRYSGSPEWSKRSILVENRLQTEPVRNRPSTFIVDRLIRAVQNDPNNADVRFRLIEQLNKYKRFQEAFDNLVILEKEYGQTDRWLALFIQTDNGFVASGGKSPVYPIDRLTYRLRFQPDDMLTRYQLVDELAVAKRFSEALDVLIDPQYADPTEEGYRGRLVAIKAARLDYARRRIVELEDILVNDPNDTEALNEIIDQYQIVERTDDAILAYVRLIELEPENFDLRARYVDALRLNGYREEAVEQAGFLVDRVPDKVEYQRLFVLSELANNHLSDRGENLLASLIAGPAREDSELILDAADYRLLQTDIEAASSLVDLAEEVGDTRFAGKIQTLRHLIAREKMRLAEEAQIAVLNDARRYTAAKRYENAIAAYDRYFELRGRRTRTELKELAQVYTAAAKYSDALAILEALQQQQYAYDVGKEIARTRILRKDYSGALATLEDLQVRNPRDYEVRFMQADALRALGLYAEAENIYNEAQILAEDSEMIEETRVAIDADVRASLLESGEWLGYDFAGIVVPTADAVRSIGGGTRYDRWAQGMQTQVTLPINVVMTAGVNSHFISGTRRLVPGSELVRGRVNQIFTGGYLDLTPPVPSDRASYSNRISGEIGLYDYEGARTVAYGGVRYWRQELGKYQGSVGIHTGEGSIELWSPGGGQFNLKLTQFDVKGASATILPDSVLRVQGSLALNVVRDNFGNSASNSDTNFGSSLQLEAGYRIVDYTYLGLTYYSIDYRTTVDTYFSPRNYETYDMFLEYERELRTKWYLRVRGAMGIVARSAGFISRRIEADLIKRLGSNFSLTARTTLSQSTRTLGSGASSFIDRYNTFTFSAALYWTL